MNVFFDCLWWWRQEVRGEPNPYTSVNQSAVGDLAAADSFSIFQDIFSYDENYFGMYQDTFSYA